MIECKLYEYKNNYLKTIDVSETLFMDGCLSINRDLVQQLFNNSRCIVSISCEDNSSLVNIEVEKCISGKLITVWSDSEYIKKITLSSSNQLYRDISRVIDGLDLLGLVVNEVRIFINEKGIVDYVSAARDGVFEWRK